MLRPFVVVCMAMSCAIGCADELVADVPQDVCFSGKQWIGERRGHPEMYPGRDCVGCHLDNDGPPLAVGGTIYPYVIFAPEIFQLQSGIDCFGIEGAKVIITDANEQVFELTTNRAGNFYIEGNPDDFAKPFNARVEYYEENGMLVSSSPMSSSPMYGGCARCHNPSAPTLMELGLSFELFPPDAEYINATARIGLPGYRDAEVRALAEPGMDTVEP